jgi:hypothetical protein
VPLTHTRQVSKLAESGQASDAAVMQGTLQAHALTVGQEHIILVCELTQGGFTRKLASGLHRCACMHACMADAATPRSLTKKPHLEATHGGGAGLLVRAQIRKLTYSQASKPKQIRRGPCYFPCKPIMLVALTYPGTLRPGAESSAS